MVVWLQGVMSSCVVAGGDEWLCCGCRGKVFALLLQGVMSGCVVIAVW